MRRVNGLIIGAVGGRDFALDIMRQRQRAHHRQQLLHRPAAFQFDDRPPRPLKANHAQRRTVFEQQPGAGRHRAMRPHQRQPRARRIIRRADEQQYHLAAAFLAHQQPGWEDPGIVEHQDVTRIQIAA